MIGAFLRATGVIARRDILATVLSRGFLVWLSMPVIGLIFGLFASIASSSGEPERAEPSSIAVIATGGDFAERLREAAALERVRSRYAALRDRYETARPGQPLPPTLERPAELLQRAELRELGAGGLQRIEGEHDLGLGDMARALGLDRGPAALTVVAPDLRGAETSPLRTARLEAQAERLLRAGSERFGAVLVVDESGAAPMLRIYRRGGGTNVDRLRALTARTWERRALEERGVADVVEAVRAATPAVEAVAVELGEAAERRQSDAETALATGAAVVLFALISLLAGVLLSNLVEEKATKVIEILVASVPIPAIFAGKLIAMLVVSLIGVGVWALVFGGGAALVLGQMPGALVLDPARGWPAFAGLVLAYFVTAYLIYGAIYLGIGALCSSIREVQTLSMPVTILQMVILVATLAAIGKSGTLGEAVASWFPLSAPYMMAARAAVGTEIGIHLAAIAWQLAFAGLTIILSARLFRFGVLRSGPPPSLKQLGKLLPRLGRRRGAEAA